MWNPFSDDFLISLGLTAMHTGKRPSELLEWNDPLDWESRLLFDMHVINLTLEEMHAR